MTLSNCEWYKEVSAETRHNHIVARDLLHQHVLLYRRITTCKLDQLRTIKIIILYQINNWCFWNLHLCEQCLYWTYLYCNMGKHAAHDYFTELTCTATWGNMQHTITLLNLPVLQHGETCSTRLLYWTYLYCNMGKHAAHDYFTELTCTATWGNMQHTITFHKYKNGDMHWKLANNCQSSIIFALLKIYIC